MSMSCVQNCDGVVKNCIRLRTVAAALAFGSLMLLPTGSALAYAEFSHFEAAPTDGGSGGRWFTGSPVDGYTCGVCHIDAEAFETVIQPLPDHYRPGSTYELEVTWPQHLTRMAGLLELTDEQGRAAGSLAVLDSAELTEADTCRPVELGVGATNIFEPPIFPSLRSRRLIGFIDCGARRFRFRWTAPATEIGPIFLAGGMVAPDDKPAFDERDIYNDHVARLWHPLLPLSHQGYELETLGRCAASPYRSRLQHGHETALLGLLLGLSALRRRRR